MIMQNISDQIISIHAPRKGSDLIASVGRKRMLEISIHAPRKGSDILPVILHTNSTPISIHAPLKGSDEWLGRAFVDQAISIHAPRKGSDFPGLSLNFPIPYFNPRSPQGERRRPV